MDALIVVVWCAIVAGVAVGMSAGGGRYGKLLVGIWLLVAGVLTCWIGNFFVAMTFVYHDDGYYMVFQWIGLGLSIAGAVVTPVSICAVLDEFRQQIRELENAVQALRPSQPAFDEKKVPAWKKVEEDRG